MVEFEIRFLDKFQSKVHDKLKEKCSIGNDILYYRDVKATLFTYRIPEEMHPFFLHDMEEKNLILKLNKQKVKII